MSVPVNAGTPKNTGLGDLVFRRRPGNPPPHTGITGHTRLREANSSSHQPNKDCTVSNGISVKGGRAMLAIAHEAAQYDEGVFMYIEGVGKREIRKVEPIEDGSDFATVHCWGSQDSPSKLLLVSLAAVRAVELN
jgi:hypothetical protein